MTEGDNPYAAPQSIHLQDDAPTGTVKLYTPAQIRLGAFLFGPLAATWYLRENFLGIGNRRGGTLVTACGIAFCLFMILAIPFIPDRVPSLTIAMVYLVLAGGVAAKFLPAKDAIGGAGAYLRQSNWQVLWFGLAGLVIFAAGLLLGIMAMNALGVPMPD